jgi:hypothetical protein
LTPDGGARLLSSPRSSTRKLIRRPPAEGLVVLPSTHRDPLLGEAEIEDLRSLAASVAEKIPASGSSSVERALPWDIEFGFFRGQAWLLQIRPLRTARLAATHPMLVALDRSVAAPAVSVDLSGALR